ncbi:MAG: hypothetical protein NT130_05025 [Candidatus Micrarchaeota archaeon]|nr:hypothetical protein [Candidatus Micrarchaeota archaeon]
MRLQETKKIDFRIKFLILAITLLFVIKTVPGLYMIDEASYFLQASQLPQGFNVENGYPALKFRSIYIFPWWTNNDNLYPSFPGNYGFMAYPFFALFGLRGLFLLNTLSFSAILWIIYSVMHGLKYRDRWGIAAILIFSFCTFSPQYATAIWPHMLSALLVLAPFYLLLKERVTYWDTAISAFILALSIGIRYTNAMFFLPLIILVIAKNYKSLISFLSTLPALFLLAISNIIRFGNPFSTGYTPSYVNSETAIGVYSHGFFSGILMHLQILYKYIFDTQSFTNVDGIAMQSTVYADGLTKALLQSSPFLSICLIGANKLWEDKKFDYLLVLCGIPIMQILYYTTHTHHGGPIHNTRYLLEAIPPLVVLSVISLAEIIRVSNKLINLNFPRMQNSTFAVILISGILFLNLLPPYMQDWYNDFRDSEAHVLEELTLFAISISLLSIIFLLTKRRELGRYVAILLLLIVLLSIPVSFLINYVFEFSIYESSVRSLALNLLTKADSIIDGRSVIISYGPSAFRMVPLKASKDVWIAAAHIDSKSSVFAVMDYGLQNNRTIYLHSMDWHPEWANWIKKNIYPFFEYNVTEKKDNETFVVVSGYHDESILCGENCSAITIEMSDSLDLFSATGFHDLENVGGRKSRWTNGNASISLPGRWVVKDINITLADRSPKEVQLNFTIQINDLQLENLTLNKTQFEELHFDVKKYKSHQLTTLSFYSNTWVPADYSNFTADLRTLGVLIEKIEISFVRT